MQDCSTLLAKALQLQRSEEFTQAAKLYAEILAIDPNHAQAQFLLGILDHKAEYFLNMGICYAALWQQERAIESLNKSIALRPQNAEAHLALGKSLYTLGEARAAIDSCQRALEIEPTLAEAHLVLSFALLALGDYTAGWKEYEWRWKFAGMTAVVREFPQPKWEGEPLAGRTILLHAEQGIGDTLQFVRYVPLVADAGGRVILEVSPALYTLLRHTPGAAECVRAGDALPQFDLQCPLMSLPLAFGTTSQSIPKIIPLVPHVLSSLAQQQTEEPAPPAKEKPRVGLVWAGNKDHQGNSQRSLDLKQLAPLWRLVNEVQFVSLQKGPEEAQLGQQTEGHPGGQTSEAQLPFALENAVATVNDFADTAEIIAGLDLVIAVDTAVAHLTGSMLKPVWILISDSPDWRWGLTGESSPWYPTARLFRATRAGGWPELLSRVAAELESFCRARNELAADVVSQ